MLATNHYANYENEIEVAPAEGPSEKVLRLAMELPESAPELEAEAVRVEALLTGMAEPATEEGADLMQYLAEILETQVVAIYGLLDAQVQEEYEHSCALLLQTHAQLEDLEDAVAATQEEQPLFG